MGQKVSPPLIVILLLLVGTCVPVIVQAPLTWIEISTDRTDYFVGELVQAKVVIQYTTAVMPFTHAKIEWFDPLGVEIFNETLPLIPYEEDNKNRATAYSNWTADRTGENFRVFVNNSSAPVGDREAFFNVWDYGDFVYVESLSLSLSRPFYENNTVAKATATLDFLGNGTLLGDVNFTWTYPNSSLAFNQKVPAINTSTNGTVNVSSYWTVNFVGSPYTVEAVYEGVPPLSDTAFFEVIPIRVKTWWNDSIDTTDVQWREDDSPYGVCDNITIEESYTLTIEKGTTVRFCPNTGLTVKGTLDMQGEFTANITLTSYSYPAGRGDWKGVVYEGIDNGPPPVIKHVRVNYSERGFVFDSSPQTLVNVSIANASTSGMESYESDLWLSDITIFHSKQGIYAFDSTLNLFDSGIHYCEDAVVAEDSNGTIEGNMINNNGRRGVWVIHSSLVIRDNTLSGNVGNGIRLENSEDNLIEGNTISWSNFTVWSYNCTNMTFLDVQISNSIFGSFSFSSTQDVLVMESSISSQDEGFVIVTSAFDIVNSSIMAQTLNFRVEGPGSAITVLNCSFDDALVSIDPGSWLYVLNYLHVKVTTIEGVPLESASVTVTEDLVPWAPRLTGPDGWVKWMVVSHETFDGRDVEPEVTSVRLEASLSGYNITNALRVVDMSMTHTEVFQGYPVVIPIDGGAFDWLLLIAIIATVIPPAVVLTLFLLLRRRKKKEEKPAAPAEVSKPAKFEPKEGKGYIFTKDGLERSFATFAHEMGRGASGLCFTRTYPPDLKERYDLEESKILWLSRNIDEGGLLPTYLGGIIREAGEFLEKNKEKRCIILLDGLGYLIAQNSFGKALKLLHALKDNVAVASGMLFVPFNLQSVDEKQAAMLTSDLEVVK
jgi:parallel beta-helix repeat protein